MTTPRRIALVTTAGLRAFHRAVADASRSADPWTVRATAVLVPTRSAASQLRRTLENLWLPPAPDGETAPDRAVVFPDILTRADWYARLQAHAAPGRALTPIEREVLLGASAREAVASGHAPPFRMRPGLVAEMLALHDALRRRHRTVADFERLTVEDLEPRAEFDRGAERLLGQTRFLVSAFRRFEERIEALGACDEHRLRQLLIAGDRASPFRRVVVTVGDDVAEPSGGLCPADFDLLARLPGIESVVLVATRGAVLAGLGERLRAQFPGLDEDETYGDADEAPVLVAPAGEERVWFSSRDREEELRDIARRLKAELRGAAPGARTAVVFRRPLPYVYLGRTVLESAGIEFTAADALPLAAEPFAAALDLVFSAVTGRFARAPLVQLLRSPHFLFAEDGREPASAQYAALDRALSEAGYLGDAARLAALAASWTGDLAAAARVASAAALELGPLGERRRVSEHVSTLLDFVLAHERPWHGGESDASRHARARAAVLGILEGLRAASLACDDPSVDVSELAAAVRRWIEAETFAPVRGSSGVHLVDAQSARYGDFDRVHLAGLVAGDWPEPSTGNIFYPAFLLAQLGWPPETARLAAERAGFVDLLRLARADVSVSSFVLADDSIVEPSPLLEEIERAGLATERAARVGRRVFADEALIDGVDAPLGGPGREWLALRRSRLPASDARFHGQAGEGRVPPLTVTAIDRYLECPFKYFARSVLGLPEEASDGQVMSPLERGRFVHEVFRAFFTQWQAARSGPITVECLDEARAVFAEVAGERLALLPPSEAALERMRLLGSAAQPGLGEVVLAAEAERPTPVTRRLLEYPFEGEFTMQAAGEERRVRLRGKADRVDLLEDGRLRVIDYKIGRAPEGSVQLPIYALCLAQHLSRAQGRRVEIGEALYIAFGERRQPVVAVLGDTRGAGEALAEAQERLVAAIDAIARGEFPPRPASGRLCATCAYAGVCRKDYVVAD